MTALTAIKSMSRSGHSSSVGMPRRKWLTVLLFPFSFEPGQPLKTIVNFDEEMRAWGRYDWVRNKSQSDLDAAAQMTVISRVAPGESVQVWLCDSCGREASPSTGVDAK